MTELGQPVYRITLNHALAMRLTGTATATASAAARTYPADGKTFLTRTSTTSGPPTVAGNARPHT